MTSQARDAGADAIVALSPPGSDGLVHYYTAVPAGAGELPVLGYHFPTMSAPGIPVEALDELPVAGLKDSSGDPDRLIAEVSGWKGGVFVGSTRTLELARSLGAAGAILGITNAEPEMSMAAFDGDDSAQCALAVARDREAGRTFPHGIKHLTSARFGVSSVVRRDRIGSVRRGQGPSAHA